MDSPPRHPRIPCTVQGCLFMFKSEKQMKRHKVDAPDHFFCKRCNVDCRDWEDLTRHKVEAMAPWLERHSEMGTNPPHICCEFCGEDFKTMGGRRKHRETEHPAIQNLSCPGEDCGQTFGRAADLVRHLESDNCRAIRARVFFAHIQKKEFIRHMFDYDGELTFLPVSTRGDPANDVSSLLMDSPYQVISRDGISSLDDRDEDTGGVALARHSEFRDDDLIDIDRAWPQLSSKAEQTIGAKSTKVWTTTSNSEQASQASFQEDKDDESAVWSFGDEDSKDTLPHVLQSLSIQHEHQQTSRTPESFLNVLLKSKDLDIQALQQPITGRYECPFPKCKIEGVSFDTVEEVEKHIYFGHTRTEYACPACSKRFSKPSSLVAHCESVGSCPIRKSKHFQNLIDDITGGFVKARAVKQERLYNVSKQPQQALVKPGTLPATGVMQAEFRAVMPSWEN